jgi:hypothetical protein
VQVAKTHGEAVAAELTQRAGNVLAESRNKKLTTCYHSQRNLYRSTSSNVSLGVSSQTWFATPLMDSHRSSSMGRGGNQHIGPDFITLVSTHRGNSVLLRKESKWQKVRKMKSLMKGMKGAKMGTLVSRVQHQDNAAKSHGTPSPPEKSRT